MILPRFIMVHDVRLCYMCKIEEIGDFELRSAYDKLCDNGRLKDEHKVLVEKGLTLALNFPKVFKLEWIKIVLIHIHETKLWLENRLMKIIMTIIHHVT